jgi:hypothetical protein
VAAPAVFVSSTFYDLRYIRGNIRYFINGLGYRPVLMEEGSIYYDPTQDVLDAALSEIPNCQMFVLVIGGRYGADFHDSGKSVTNAEYVEAAKLKIPIFALVEQGVYNDFHVWRANRNDDKLVSKIDFPNTDDIRVFSFIEEVQNQAVNNALVPFRDWSDIETYLRLQWAGMMHSFLSGRANAQRVEEYLDVLAEMNKRIEMLSTQILNSVGTDRAKATARMFARMLPSRAIDDLRMWRIIPRPSEVIANQSIDDLAAKHGTRVVVEEDNEGSMITSSGEISPERYRETTDDYTELREALIALLDDSGMSLQELERQEALE